MTETPITKLIEGTAERLHAVQAIDGPLSLNDLKSWLCEFALRQLDITKLELNKNTEL